MRRCMLNGEVQGINQYSLPSSLPCLAIGLQQKNHRSSETQLL